MVPCAELDALPTVLDSSLGVCPIPPLHSRLPCRVVNFGGFHSRLEGNGIHCVEEFKLERDGVSIVLTRNGIILRRGYR